MASLLLPAVFKERLRLDGNGMEAGTVLTISRLHAAACLDSGPDWARTSDPALIKRML